MEFDDEIVMSVQNKTKQKKSGCTHLPGTSDRVHNSMAGLPNISAENEFV
jgi:hypothetical protein